MKDYKIIRRINGYKNARSASYYYYINKNGKALHDGAAKMTFTSKKKAEAFADNFDEDKAFENGYRWF